MENKENTLKAFGKFIEVVEALRGENGCPWDRAQTHGSLRMELIEEAYEAADAMFAFEEKKQFDNLREELGDLLLHVIMHGVIAEEENIFTVEDIVTEITEKMIHRHPHVFRREEWEKEEKKKSWEQLKSEEAGHSKEKVLPLHGIPKALPALLRMSKVLKKADTIYGKKIDREESVQQLALLGKTLEKVENKTQQEKVMTSMLYHMCNLAWQDKINQEELLMNQIEKVINGLEPEIRVKGENRTLHFDNH